MHSLEPRWLWDKAVVKPILLLKGQSPFHIKSERWVGTFTHQVQYGEGDVMQEQLCPVHALIAYVETTASLCQPAHISVCNDSMSKGRALSKQRLPKWIVEVITNAYMSKGLPLSEKITGYSTQHLYTSWAALNGVPLTDICATAQGLYHVPLPISIGST